MDNILVIASHPDDEIIGVGATIKKLVNKEKIARTIILGEGITSRKESDDINNKEELEKLKYNTLRAAKIIGYSSVDFLNIADNRFDSVDLLDIVKKIYAYIEKYKPDTIFTQYYGDLNIDHQLTYRAVITAARPVNNCSVKEIHCFETLSSTEWNFNGQTFSPNCFFNIEDEFEFKEKAMRCYEGELCKFPHPRSIEAMESVAKKWGSVCDCKKAEAFVTIRKYYD